MYPIFVTHVVGVTFCCVLSGYQIKCDEVQILREEPKSLYTSRVPVCTFVDITQCHILIELRWSHLLAKSLLQFLPHKFTEQAQPHFFYHCICICEANYSVVEPQIMRIRPGAFTYDVESGSKINYLVKKLLDENQILGTLPTSVQ